MSPYDARRGRDGSSDTSPIGERIRERRERISLTGVELAARVGISPSYLSLIENRGRIPSEEVAERLAEALGDDVDLYLAWSRSRNVDDLEEHLRRMHRYKDYSSDPKGAGLLRSLGPRPRPEVSDRSPDDRHESLSLDAEVAELDHVESTGLASESRQSRSRSPASAQPGSLGSVRQRALRYLGLGGRGEEDSAPASARPGDRASRSLDGGAARRSEQAGSVLKVPVLHDGDDPEADPRVIETLELDARLFPPGTQDVFAYRPDLRAVRLVRHLVHPGDLVVLQREPGPFGPRSLHAVRYDGRVVLARIARKGGRLAMLPPPNSSYGFELIDLDPDAPSESDALREVVVGSVIATFRLWSPEPPRRSSS